MAKSALAPDDVVRMAHDRYHHPCPQIQNRMEVLWLASHAKPTQEAVAELAGVQRFLATYRREGLDGVQRRHYVRAGSELEAQATTLEEYFLLHPPATVAEASPPSEPSPKSKWPRSSTSNWSTCRPTRPT